MLDLRVTRKLRARTARATVRTAHIDLEFRFSATSDNVNPYQSVVTADKVLVIVSHCLRGSVWRGGR